MAVKISELRIENVKRVKAFEFQPSESGLTVIGGRNGQGKTSVLDAIAWALGGERHRPTTAHREGSVLPPDIHITLSNGLIVERRGKNSSLKITDPMSRQSGQQLLNSFVSQLALDLPQFMAANSKEKANTLLKIIGVGDELRQIEGDEARLYNERTAIGRVADQKEKFAKELPAFNGVPDALISASELIREQQVILAHNAENQRKRSQLAELESRYASLQEQLALVSNDLEIARKSATDLHDESTAALECSINDTDDINRKVRANLDRDKANEDAHLYRKQYDAMSIQLEDLRTKKMALLDSAALPLPGLTVIDGELKYKGYAWDCLSGSEQLRVATAIVRCLNPNCGFILLDKLEQMDMQTMAEFGQWLEQEGLQAIATRVSTGGECSIIIEDGQAQEPMQKQWKAGLF